MVKKIYIIASSAALLASACLWTGCSDDFLKDKTDYKSYTPTIYNDYTGAKMRIDNMYLRMQPNANTDVTYRWPSSGRSDVQMQATEEYTGVGYYTDPKSAAKLPYTTDAPALFNESYKTSESPYGEIRNCNDIIEGVAAGTLPDEQKKELMGQAYFFRAWQYYLLVKTYGGVPLVKEVQAADVSLMDDAETPRSTTKECIDFICEDLERAFEMLPEAWGSNDIGRVHKGAALAVMGRARLLYASPLFNRGDDRGRWEVAYDANKRAKDWLEAHGYGLAYLDNPGVNAEGWAKMFSGINDPEVRKEAVLATLYNMLNDSNSPSEPWRNNNREQGLRPRNASGSGNGTAASERMVDMFPMADGKRPGYGLPYDKKVFFKDRDPRFYRTFAFPGIYWRFDGDSKGLQNMPTVATIYNGPDYVLWNYAWYDKADEHAADNQKGYAADRLADNYQGVYVRKRSNDFDMKTLAPTRLYRWPSNYTENAGAGLFGEGAMPHIEIRFTEVLLNLAESACGIDQTDEALNILKDIRKRAGYEELVAAGKAQGDYGLVNAGRGEMFGAVLYERQIEFAYEGKRFDDMRRWLLWDGGTKFGSVAGAPGTWQLSGYGGNTIDFLGYWAYTNEYPFNGKLRNNFELCAKVDNLAPKADASDPLLSSRPAAALDLKVPMADQATVIAGLETFYTNFLDRKTRRGDDENRVVSFLPNFYFLGLSNSAQGRNPKLKQTIGWADTKNGDANGTFDPLAE